MNEESLQVRGNADFIFDSARNTYDIEANLNIMVHDMKLELQILYIQNKIFIVLYDNVIELTAEDLGELYTKVTEKIDLEPSTMSMDLSILVDVMSQIIVHENSIELDLSSILSFLTKVIIEYTLTDGQYSISLDIDSLATLRVDFVAPTKAQLEEPKATLNKEDLFVLLDDVAYLMDLLEYGAIQIEIADGKIHLNVSGTEEEILLNGRIDLLLNNNEIQLAGQFEIEGFGVIAGVDFILIQEKVFITISNQTFCLNLAELDSFIESAMEILAPMVQFDSQPNLNINTNIDLKNLGFFLSSNSISIELDELVSKACQLCLIFELIEDKLAANISGSFDTMLSVDLSIVISKSDVKEITVPANYLTEADILEILSYVVEAYELAQRKEFNLEFNTIIDTDGRIVAEIEGYLYIKLLDNQEFDARLKLYVNEYKSENETAWHQLDLQIISKTTIQTLSNDFACAMIFGTYGNNPNDVSAVIKLKSTYEGIENLIFSVLQLLNINTSSLSIGTFLENLDLRSIIDYIEVSQSEVSLGIPAEILFESMQDEKQTISITLRKNLDAKLSGIEISNLYVSYTNLRSYMKLDSLCLNLSEEAPLELVVPTDYDTYYDVSNIANLVEAFYNNALEKSFEITGTVTLTALNIINVNMPVLLKVTVDENGAPIIYVHMNMMNIGLGTLMMSKKNIYIYYKDNYVYIHRDDSKDANDRKIKIHYTEFLDNLVYYLMDYAMGLPDSILSLVNKTPEGDGFIDASQCINDVNIGTSEFMINLNLKEIADNNDLGKLVVTIASSLVAKTDELGNYILDENGNICYV
ncbi:MAG: hypothetical protein K2K15_00510, partial [Anaeroplasmataceae bacterium]|nr:hypothetical protein [Anaeroplasmataceae bacterium]